MTKAIKLRGVRGKVRSYATGRARCNTYTCTPGYTGFYAYTLGCVVTPHGVVSLYHQPNPQAILRLCVIHAGREFELIRRGADAYVTERGMAQIASRFARAVAEVQDDA